jgi:hypothetical protein
MQEIDRIFPDGEADVGVERKLPDMGQVGHRELGRVKSREVTRTNLAVRPPNLGHNATYHPRFDTGAHYRVGAGTRNQRKSSRPPPHEYEVVNQKVVEETPEKTVAITTWREQVARETSPDPNDVETMSIHYMGLEDYAAVERTLTEVDSNLQSAPRTLPETGRTDSIRSTRPANEPSKEVVHPVVDSEGSTPASPVESEVRFKRLFSTPHFI